MRTMQEKDASPVLLAEDNEINQFVAVHLLEKHGFAVDVAANGRLALEMCQRRTYEAVFMDCHMPELDGYEATAEIRRREAPGRHMPIIAMTADVLDGDRARCLAAGMDDYVGKPIDPEALKDAIARLLDADRGDARYVGPVSGEVDQARPQQEGRTPLLDHSILNAVCAGDTQMRQDLVGLFADHWKAALADMGRAIQTCDSEALQHHADRLKRSSVSVGALRMGELCQRLWRAGRADGLDEAPALLGELERASELTRAAWHAGLSAALAAPRRP
jgi:two-component system sensor histidine kinase/response regulator